MTVPLRQLRFLVCVDTGKELAIDSYKVEEFNGKSITIAKLSDGARCIEFVREDEQVTLIGLTPEASKVLLKMLKEDLDA